MNEILLDASALLALLNEESGMDVVAAALAVSCMSAVNATEVMAVLARQWGPDMALARFSAFRIPILPFVSGHAEEAQQLLWRHRGAISLADAACIATAKIDGIPLLTADRIWATLPLGIEICLIRP